MQLRIMTEPQLGASYDDQLASALAAEAAGFDGWFRSDHFLTFAGDGLPGPTDAWVTLGALARETSRVRLGTLVTSMTFRHPGMLAVQVAQVDAMSASAAPDGRGRVELGLGTGWFEQEHRVHGVPFPPLGERFERLEEQLQIVTGMWSTPVGERFSFEGRHHRVEPGPALPKPAQSPRLPIIVGGRGPRRTPRLAATYADEINLPGGDVAAVREAVARADAACEAQGRDPATLVKSAMLTTICGADEADLSRRAGRVGRTVEQARAGGLGGTPAEVVERLGELAGAGLGRAYLQLFDLRDLDHVHLLGSEVRPAVA